MIMTRFFHGLVLVACTAALSTGCCKQGEDSAEPASTSTAAAEAPASGGATITGASALEKLKAKGFTPLTDPVVSDVAGLKSTAAVLKPDMIVVNVIEYSDESMAKMAASAGGSAEILTHQSGKSVVRVTCAGKPKEKCENIMSIIKE
jgi:hypothetical protein